MQVVTQKTNPTTGEVEEGVQARIDVSTPVPITLERHGNQIDWPVLRTSAGPYLRVVVTDLDVPFVQLVIIMVKVTIAAIPAALIAGLIMLIVGGFLSVLGLAAL